MSQTIVFFGSGPVAAESLQRLHESFEIEAVITKPRPPRHKGDVPVVELAESLDLPLLYVRDQVELGQLFATRPVQSELAILIDFGIIVSQTVIDYFPLGIVNSHFSILPEWRGADPITFSVLSGQSVSGVSLMLVSAGLDEGELLAFEEHVLAPDITTPRLTEEYIALSHKMLLETIPGYISGDIQPFGQNVTGRNTSYSKKLTKQDGQLDWSKPALQLEREVRAYLDWPRSRTTLNDMPIIITQASVTAGQGEPGKLYVDNKQLGIYTAKDILIIESLIPAGKKEMPAQAFLAGYKIKD